MTHAMESFIGESFFYLFFAGFVQTGGALLIAPFFLPIPQRLRSTSFASVLHAYFVFNGFLLLWGCLGHYAFHVTTFGKLYVSADRLVDWYPFIPFGQWVLDQSLGDLHGHLLGSATLWQLRWIWLAFAAPVWLLTYASTIFTLRLRQPFFPRRVRLAGPA